MVNQRKPEWIKYFDRSTGLGSDRIKILDWIRIPKISDLFNTNRRIELHRRAGRQAALLD